MNPLHLPEDRGRYAADHTQNPRLQERIREEAADDGGSGEEERPHEGPQWTFPPPPPVPPPPDLSDEEEGWVPGLSRRGAPHAASLADAELEKQLTRLVLSLMVAPQAGDGAASRRRGAAA
jgi:hypothetical protein